jgi:hypothetical protein
MEELEFLDMAKEVEIRVGTVASVIPMPKAMRRMRKKKGNIGLRDGSSEGVEGEVEEEVLLEFELSLAFRRVSLLRVWSTFEVPKRGD